jgi:hypothetical protein
MLPYLLTTISIQSITHILYPNTNTHALIVCQCSTPPTQFSAELEHGQLGELGGRGRVLFPARRSAAARRAAVVAEHGAEDGHVPGHVLATARRRVCSTTHTHTHTHTVHNTQYTVHSTQYTVHSTSHGTSHGTLHGTSHGTSHGTDTVSRVE